jgi:carboxynorspermidine decarboxylase
VAFSKDEICQVRKYADKIIFNSLSQLKMFHKHVAGFNVGLRINPGISYSRFDLADPARQFSRLGVVNKKALMNAAGLINGIMFHFNCENSNFKNFSDNLKIVGKRYKSLLQKIDWVSLGGGIHFTKDGYPLDRFCKLLKGFSDSFGVQVYLEPGESAVTGAGELVTKVLDIVSNKVNIAIVDSSIEAHMLDLLIYREKAKIRLSGKGNYKYMIAGRSCLAGDIFGTFKFKNKLKIGDIITIDDAAGYTMVKKNWFNGLSMPSIVLKRTDGTLRLVRQFEYKDFLGSLS